MTKKKRIKKEKEKQAGYLTKMSMTKAEFLDKIDERKKQDI